VEAREYTKEEKEQSIKRFHALDEDLRDRILNAALLEFSHGYKKASTDVIVREAGISKGFLFKCFLTKENLYDFMVDFAQETVSANYFDMINLGQRDILESFWQMSLLKQEIAYRYPSIIDFLYGVYRYMADCPNVEVKTLFFKKEKNIFDELCNQCDTSKFRSDIDPKKAIEFIWWGFEGFYTDYSRMKTSTQTEEQQYDEFLDALRGYVDMCRKCFYKQ
jgi:AcrR family transcriptional regulator